MERVRTFWPMVATAIALAVAGLLWGGDLGARVAAVERQQNDWKDVRERLARIEQSLGILLDDRERPK